MRALVLAVALLFLVSMASAGCKDICDYKMCTTGKCPKNYYPEENCYCSTLKKQHHYCCVSSYKKYPMGYED